jgi:Amt family ammonium transporter
MPSLAPTIPLSLYFVFQMLFAVATPALIIGSVADR